MDDHKRGGRCVGDPIISVRRGRNRDEHTKASAAIDAALRSGFPCLMLSPILDLSGGRCFALEALSSAPAKMDQPLELELALAIQALDLLKALPTTISVSVNVSPATLISDEFAPAIRRYPQERIIVEISDYAECPRPDALAEQVELLQFRGVRIAIDNLSGCSSRIQPLLRLSPDFMKLSRSLVAGIATDPAKRAEVVSLQWSAMEKRIELIADGIEATADFNTLLGMGIWRGQGRLLGRPLDPVAALARISLLRHAGLR